MIGRKHGKALAEPRRHYLHVTRIRAELEYVERPCRWWLMRGEEQVVEESVVGRRRSL
jgi:hypothetical protein